VINRTLGIDNCIGCIHKRRLPDELLCSKYKKKLEITCYGIPLKLSYCTEPFKYDSNDENNSDEEVVN